MIPLNDSGVGLSSPTKPLKKLKRFKVDYIDIEEHKIRKMG